MPYDWIDKGISQDELARLKECLVDAYNSKAADITDYFLNDSRHELKCFITVLLDSLQGPGNPRHGFLPRLSRPMTQRELYSDLHLYLSYQLTLIDQRLGMELDDVWIPGLALDFGVDPVVNAFGAGFVQPLANANPWATPAISHIDQVYSLSADLESSFACTRILDAIQIWREITGGMIPIRSETVVGPFTAASELIGQTVLMTALYTNPQEVHHLIGNITQAIITWRAKENKASKNMLWGSDQYCVPATGAITLGDDSHVTISPKMVEEFVVPCLSKISQRFEGLFVHYCGGYTHNLRSLAQIPNLMGIDSQFDVRQFEEAREILGSNTIILTRVRNRQAGVGDLDLDYLRAFVRVARGTRTIVWLFADSLEQAKSFCRVIAEG